MVALATAARRKMGPLPGGRIPSLRLYRRGEAIPADLVRSEDAGGVLGFLGGRAASGVLRFLTPAAQYRRTNSRHLGNLYRRDDLERFAAAKAEAGTWLTLAAVAAMYGVGPRQAASLLARGGARPAASEFAVGLRLKAFRPADVSRAMAAAGYSVESRHEAEAIVCDMRDRLPRPVRYGLLTYHDVLALEKRREKAADWRPPTPGTLSWALRRAG